MTTYCSNPVCCCIRRVAKVIDAYPASGKGAHAQAMVVRGQLHCRHVKTFVTTARQLAEVGR